MGFGKLVKKEAGLLQQTCLRIVEFGKLVKKGSRSVAANLPKNCGIGEVSKKRKQVRHGKLA